MEHFVKYDEAERSHRILYMSTLNGSSKSNVSKCTNISCKKLVAVS